MQVVKTKHKNGEERYWVLLGPVRVIDFQQAATRSRKSPVQNVEFLERIDDVPGTIAELMLVQE